MPMDLFVASRVIIPGAELSATAVRASGPGGQNVNKVSTKVELRFDLRRTSVLDPGTKGRLRSLAAGRLDADGQLLVVSQLTRSRERNLEDAREKLAELVRRALVAPTPRKKTRPSAAMRRQRLEGKRRHSEKKRARSQPSGDD